MSQQNEKRSCSEQNTLLIHRCILIYCREETILWMVELAAKHMGLVELRAEGIFVEE